MNIDGLIGHIRTVVDHKKWVWYYCSRLGMYKVGLLHDLSKFSPTELLESAEYYAGGTSSPINEAKKDKGYSLAWFHHKGRNRHHYEYWFDNIDTGGTKVKMPEEYANELICDYLGAGRAYMKHNFSYYEEYKWWLGKRDILAMNTQTKIFVDHVIVMLAYMEAKYNAEIAERDIFNSVYLHDTYMAIEKNDYSVDANTMEAEIKLKNLVGETANSTKCKIITMWPNSTCKYADENGMCTRTIDDDVISDILNTINPSMPKDCPIIIYKVFDILKDHPKKWRLKKR